MRKNRRNILRLFYISAIISIFCIAAVWWINGIQPVNRNLAYYQEFSVENGTGLKAIAEKLKADKLIRDKYVFLAIVKILGIERSLQAGEFELTSSMDTFTIAKTLTRSTTDIRITFPEGKRAEEVAEILANHFPGIDREKAIIELGPHQGYLFPDTYNFEKSATIEDIIAVMKANFENKYSTLTFSSKLSKDEITTIASMIEREARLADDRPLVASVIHNRLNIGMKLDIDATVQYALGYNNSQRSWWKKGLSLADLTVDSPFNTYANPGLPPMPIANPGLSSLQAAANPADTNYLFYFTDKNGVNHYAQTLSEQNKNINKFGL